MNEYTALLMSFIFIGPSIQVICITAIFFHCRGRSHGAKLVNIIQVKSGASIERESFREALFHLIELLTDHTLSDSGKKLVTHYFNDIKEYSTYERALLAIEKYYPESMPPEEKTIEKTQSGSGKSQKGS